jgi:hypothetical protein
MVQALPAQYDLSTTFQTASGAGAVKLAFGTQTSDDGYTLSIDPHGLSLKLRDGSAEQSLESMARKQMPPMGAQPIRIRVEKRRGYVAVLADSRLLAQVENAGPDGGTAELTTSGDAVCSPLRMQPIEPFYFADDFMRQPTEKGEWSYDAGNWRIQTTGIVERGANPFSLEGVPGPVALASTGYPFWNNYSFEVAIKGSAGTTLGACVDLQDPQNYYRLRWSAGPQGDIQLQRVVDGKATTLAHAAGGFIPGQWYLVGFRTGGGQLVAQIDHQPVLTASDTTFGEGKIGLYAEGSGQTVWFDSVVAHAINWVDDHFSSGSPIHWTVADQRSLGGSPEASDYTVTARVTGSRRVSALILHYRDTRNFDMFAWDSGSCRLMSVVDGHRHVLASTKRGIRPGQSSSVEVGSRNGYMWASIDNVRMLDAVDFELPAGRAGFQPASGEGSLFQSITIAPIPVPEPTDGLTQEFTEVQKHPDMQGWAGPYHAWESAQLGQGAGYWHKGDLYGDTDISVPLNAGADSQFTVFLNSDGKTVDSGYAMVCSTHSGTIDVALSRLGKQVVAGKASLQGGQPDASATVGPAATPTLDIFRRGDWIYALVGKQVALSYHDPAPVDGYSLPAPDGYASDQGGHSKLGVLVSKGPVNVPGFVITNPNVYSETFHLAPVNWRSQGGSWEIASRWSCQPGWTWYGGKGTSYTANWHKAAMWGDQTIDYYTAAMMSATQDAGREAWQDLNCSFCADGVNLFSGYTLMVGGWHNTFTRLYRKGQMVAENGDFHFPSADTAHRLWYDVRITRQGASLDAHIYWVDGAGNYQSAPLLKWTDPDPLAGGFACFWTHDNGIMLARAVLACQQRGAEPLYSDRPVWSAETPQNVGYPAGKDLGFPAYSLVQPDMMALLPTHMASQIGPGALPIAPPNSAPVRLASQDLSMIVEPGGTLSHVRYRGKEVFREVLLDIRTSEWHQISLTAENTHVKITQGADPQVHVDFDVRRPDAGIMLTGSETIRVLPNGALRVDAAVDPSTTFSSNRISINLVIPSDDYTGKQFRAITGGVTKNIPVPAQPLYPIQMATAVQRLETPVDGMDIRPIAGMGTFEDLRHYSLNELWFEQQAQYDYPKVPQGAERHIGLEVRFSGGIMASGSKSSVVAR